VQTEDSVPLEALAARAADALIESRRRRGVSAR
jgi:hypothetical protein